MGGEVIRTNGLMIRRDRRGRAGRSVILLVLLSLAGCGSAQTPRAPAVAKAVKPAKVPSNRGTSLQIQCTPADALLTVDGRDIGAISKLGKASVLLLSPGLHRLEFRKEGYIPFRIELKLKENQEQLKVRLDPIAAAHPKGK